MHNEEPLGHWAGKTLEGVALLLTGDGDWKINESRREGGDGGNPCPFQHPDEGMSEAAEAASIQPPSLRQPPSLPR